MRTLLLAAILGISLAIVSCGGGTSKKALAPRTEPIVIGPEKEDFREPIKWHKRW